MKSRVTSQKAYYVSDQVLFFFQSKNARSDHVFVNPKRGASIPRWILTELTMRFGGVIPVDQSSAIAVPLSPTLSGRARTLVRVALANLGKDSVPGLVETFYTDPNKRDDIVHEPSTVIPIDISPNWLCGAAPQVIGTGGPGGPPMRPAKSRLLTGGSSTMVPGFVDSLSAGSKGVRECDVDVYILDTLNAVAQQSGGRTELRATPALPHAFDGLVNAAGQPNYVASNPYYDMSDHGPFIAGIVKRIAPVAKVHIVQVLNEYGIGSVASIASGFDLVRRDRQEERREKISAIINCSFTIAVPVLAEKSNWNPKRDCHFHESADLDETLRSRLMLDCGAWPTRIFDAICRLESRVRGSKKRCQIVAAAGNDSLVTTIRPAGYPARLDDVIGVGALNENQAKAPYSNYPDSPVEQGLMVLGTVRSVYLGLFPKMNRNGNIMTQAGSGAVKKAQVDTKPGSGIAEWSGTSFAAPVITGLLAKLASQNCLPLSEAEATLRGSEPTVQGATGEFEPATGGEIVSVTQS